MACLLPAVAQAQCTPSAQTAGQAITCSGTTTGTYPITTNNSPLTVTADGSITADASALVVTIPAQTNTYVSRSATIIDNGAITSTSGDGVIVLSGPSNGSYYDYYGTNASITVGAGGSISGTTGILAIHSADPLSVSALANVTLDNAGTITGTGGVALYAGTGGNFSSITNEATGTINGTIGGASGGYIGGIIGQVTNAGTIDGGNQTAINGANSYYFAPAVTNSGTIKSEGAAATIANAQYLVLNSGMIANTGGGDAVAYGNVTNQSGGTISANGADVIGDAAMYSTAIANSGSIINTGNGNAITAVQLNVTNNAGGVITAGNGGNAVNGTNLYLANSAGGVINAGAGGLAVNASTSITLTNAGTINGDVYAGSIATSYFGIYT